MLIYQNLIEKLLTRNRFRGFYNYEIASFVFIFTSVECKFIVNEIKFTVII